MDCPGRKPLVGKNEPRTLPKETLAGRLERIDLGESYFEESLDVPRNWLGGQGGVLLVGFLYGQCRFPAPSDADLFGERPQPIRI